MRPVNVLYLYRIRLRSRLVQELLALAGIAVGVGLVFAALVASTSLTGSMRQLTEGVVGKATVQLAARGPEGFDERLVEATRAIDGVRTAAPVMEARANLVGPAGRESVLLLGGDPRFSRLDGTLLPNFADVDLSGQGSLALPGPLAERLGLSLGQTVAVEADATVTDVALAARLDAVDIGPLVHHPVALATLGAAQSLSGMQGRITRIFVEVEPGRDAAVARRLERVASADVAIRPADADVEVFERAAYPTNQSTALFSVFSALVGFLFAFSAVLLTVSQRRNLITDIRMAGHGPATAVQVLLFDALVLGLAGSAVGLALGDQVSRHLFDTAPGYLAAAFALGSPRIVTWQSVAIAGGVGVVAACIAVLAPLGQILSHRPRRDRQRPGPRSRRAPIAPIGIASLGVAAVIVAAFPSAALIGLFALTLALLLLLPSLLSAVARAFDVLTRTVSSAVPTLAILELRSREARTRTLALAATGAIAVFATVAIGGAHADLERGLDASARDIDQNADIWVTFRGQANTLATTPFDDLRPSPAQLERLPGVRHAHWYRGGFLDIDDRRTWVIAPPRSAPRPLPPSQIKRGEASTATARLREGGWVAVSEGVAADMDAGVGDRIMLPSPRPTTFRVAAVTTNLGWPPGALVMNAEDYATAWSSDAASALHIAVASDASHDAVARAVDRRLGPRAPMRVETADERVDRHYALTREGLSRLSEISVLVLLSAVLAMTTTMAGMIWQRRRTLAALKVQGYSERELWSALLCESALLLGTACVAGAAFGLFGQVLLSRALEAITGFPVFYSAGGLIALGILGGATVLATAMLALPGWLAVRVPPQPGVPR